MESLIETMRLTPEDWRDAVNRALHVHDESHAISSIRARKYVPALVEMIAECGVSGMVMALASAIRLVSRRRPLGVEGDDPLATHVTASRLVRCVRKLRRMVAADDVREATYAELEAA